MASMTEFSDDNSPLANQLVFLLDTLDAAKSGNGNDLAIKGICDKLADLGFQTEESARMWIAMLG